MSVDATGKVLDRLSDGEIAGGGAVYDALVGAVAVEHGFPLATLDRRALGASRVVGVEVEIIPPGGHGESS